MLPADAIDRFDGTEFEFLSNFSLDPITFRGKVWPTSEHAYQAFKSELEEDQEFIRSCKTPGQAKKAGNKSITIRPDWDHVKIHVMLDILRVKFTQKELAGKLIATGPRLLIEGNTWNDRFWGVCKGVGQNWLGRLLMQVRDELNNNELTII